MADDRICVTISIHGVDFVIWALTKAIVNLIAITGLPTT
jgi:hypothetical protein